MLHNVDVCLSSITTMPFWVKTSGVDCMFMLDTLGGTSTEVGSSGGILPPLTVPLDTRRQSELCIASCQSNGWRPIMMCRVKNFCDSICTISNKVIGIIKCCLYEYFKFYRTVMAKGALGCTHAKESSLLRSCQIEPILIQ